MVNLLYNVYSRTFIAERLYSIVLPRSAALLFEETKIFGAIDTLLVVIAIPDVLLPPRINATDYQWLREDGYLVIRPGIAAYMTCPS